MSDQRISADPRPRTSRRTAVAVLIGLALVVGLVLLALGARRYDWFTSSGAVQTATAPLASDTAGAPAAAQPSLDPASLAARQAALAGQLTALEAQLASLQGDASAAGGEAGRAEALLVAFAARRAIDRGLPLGYLDEQLRQRFAATQPQAVSILIGGARQPVTVEDLRQGLDALAPDLASTSGSGSWLTDLRRGLGSLVVLRRAGTPSPAPVDRLARIRRLLDGRQIDAARVEVARLPGAANAGNWMVASARYVRVHRALDRIEAAALVGQGSQPQG